METGNRKDKNMIELKSDRLVVSFPDLPHQPEVTIDFQRTFAHTR